MNRSEFMFTLAQLLADMPFEERSEALKFYNSYFDDAGPENEQHIIEELKSPEAVAKSIRAGLDGSAGKGEFREDGYHETYEKDGINSLFKKAQQSYDPNYVKDHSAAGGTAQRDNAGQAADAHQKSSSYYETAGSGQQSNGQQGNGWQQGNSWQQNSGQQGNGWQQNSGQQGNGWQQSNGQQGNHWQQGGYQQSGAQNYNYNYQNRSNNPYQQGKRHGKPLGKNIWIIILCICAAPILVGLAGGALGLVGGIIGGIFGIIGAVFGGVFGGIFGGIGCFIKGIVTCFTSPAEGLAICGMSLLSIAGGVLLLMLGVWLCSSVVPKVWAWIKKMWHKITRRRKDA